MTDYTISEGLYAEYVLKYSKPYEALTKDEAVYLAVELCHMGYSIWYHPDTWHKGNLDGPYYPMTVLYLDEMKQRTVEGL